MALESATNFKAATALAAVQLTAALQDTVKTELAAEVKQPYQPLRRIDKLFILNNATGVYTSNDAYIDLAYAGNFPNVGSNTKGIGNILPVLVSADVEIAAPSDIVLVFDKPISKLEALAVAGTVTTEKTITGFSVDGATVTIFVSSPYIVSDTITASGIFYVGNNQVTLAAEAVTNNIV